MRQRSQTRDDSPASVAQRGRRSAGRPFARACALLLPLLLAAACAAGPSIRPPIAIKGADAGQPGTSSSAGGPTPLPPLDRPADPTVAFTDCTGPTVAAIGTAPPAGLSFACGKISSLLDPPGLPGRGTVRLAVLKAGNGPIPLVVVNDTQGEAGTLFAARLATQLPAEFLQTFSLIAIDRRGTGGSSPTNCVPAQARQTITGFDPAAADKDMLTRLLDAARSATQECSMALDKRVVAYDSWRSAADLDTLRSALGVPRLNAVARGTGSQVLTTYRVRFPEKVGRMVLDGSPNPKLDDIAQHEAAAAGAQDALASFAGTCAAQRGCPLTPDPLTALPALAQQLTAQPAKAAGGRSVDGGVLYAAVLAGLADPTRWPMLTEALISAKAGDGSGIAGFAQPIVAGGDAEPARFDAQLTSQCNDTTTRVPLERLASLAGEWKTKYPAFGAYFAQQLVVCSPWPTAARSLPAPTASGPSALVLGTSADPVTPLVSTRRMAQEISAPLVQWQGAGHGALPNSACATAAVQRYLVGGQIPSADVVCPP